MAVNSTSLFSVDGLVSGLSTAAIIDRLMAVERAPLTQLTTQRQRVQDRTKAYQDLRTRLAGLQTAVKTLLDPSAVNAKTATTSTPSTSPTILTATAGAGAANGTFTVRVDRLATATTVSSASGSTAQAVGTPISQAAPLRSAGFAITPTSGTFTINGQTVTVDATVDTILAVRDRINATAGIGVTASLALDAYGNANVLRLTATTTGTPIQLGSGADTSNFLAAARLVANGTSVGPGVTDVVNSGLLGTALPGEKLSSGRFATALNDNGGTGAFTINGVAVTWTANDSLSTVLSRINAANAGVRASYDAATDRVTLASTATGNQAISLQETSGNFLQAMQLTTATQAYGTTAQYAIDSRAVQYSNSNTIANAVPGVTLNLVRTDPSAVTVTVAQDADTAAKNLRAFVDQFNQLVAKIQDLTKYDATNKQASVLTGDVTVLGLERTIRSAVASPAEGLAGAYRSFADIGISTGAYGSAVGSTSQLVLDEAKLRTALADNPGAVQGVVSALAATATLRTGGTWIGSISGLPRDQVYSGSYAVTWDGTSAVTATFTRSLDGLTLPQTSGTISPGGTNSSLILGITIAANASGSGTDSIDYTVSSRGVLQSLNAYVNQALGPDGAFQAVETSANDQIRALDQRIQAMEDRLALRRQQLQKKFTALEVALSKLQGQGSQLASALASLQR